MDMDGMAIEDASLGATGLTSSGAWQMHDQSFHKGDKDEHQPSSGALITACPAPASSSLAEGYTCGLATDSFP